MKKLLIVIALALTGGLMMVCASGAPEKVNIEDFLSDDVFVGTWRYFAVSDGGQIKKGDPRYDFIFIDSSHFKIVDLTPDPWTGEGTYTFSEPSLHPSGTFVYGEITFNMPITTNLYGRGHVWTSKYSFSYESSKLKLSLRTEDSDGINSFVGGMTLIKQ